MPKSLVFKCYVERDESDSWFAMCVDLNLYARAASMQLARERLHDEIKTYVAQAYTVDREHFADLIPRRAPLRFWLKYYSGKALGNVTSRRPTQRFNETVPLEPAF